MKSILCFLISIFFMISSPCKATVNVVVTTNEGFVVAADSRTTARDGNNTRIISDNSKKVVKVGSHAAVTLSGAAAYVDEESNMRSCYDIITDYLHDRYGIYDTLWISPDNIAFELDSTLTVFFKKNVQNSKIGNLEILICGYSNSGYRRFYDMIIPYKTERSDSIQLQYQRFSNTTTTSDEKVGTCIAGYNDIFQRLMTGYDHSLDSIIRQARINPDSLKYDPLVGFMTLQDAIDWAMFIINTTVEAQRFFKAMPQNVGGTIDIAVITPDGFKWIQHKQLHGE